MNLKDAAWNVFRATGYIGAYLVYRDYCEPEETVQVQLSQEEQENISAC